MKKLSVLKLISLIFVCAMLIGAVAVTALATEGENTVEIAQKNIFFGDTIQLMVAVNAPEGATVTATVNGEPIEIEPCDAEGANYPTYKTVAGWAAQDINTVVTITAEYDGVKDVLNYSVLQYLYDRIALLENANPDDKDDRGVTNAEKLAMYDALLAYAKAADKVVNHEKPNNLDEYYYVTIVDGTFDGYNDKGMFKKGDKPFANIEHALDLGTNEKVEWTYSVNGEDMGVIEYEELKTLTVKGEVVVTATAVEGECQHETVNTVKVVAPTCTEKGYTVYECTSCPYTYNGDEKDALGHNLSDATCTAPATCQNDGCDYTEGEALGHSYENYVCKNCGDSLKKVYTFSNYAAGTQYAENEEHVLDSNTTVVTTDCHFTSELRIYSSSTNNGYAIIKSVNPMKEIILNAGYKVDTLVVYGSNDKGATWTEITTVSVTSTSYKDYIVTFETAYEWIKLDVQGANQIRIKTMTLCTLPACEHEATTTKTVAPTCTEAGYTATVCVACGAEQSRVEGEAATGHLHTTEKTVDATCTVAGSVTVTCDDCNATISTETIPATNHPNTTTTTVDATCTKDGSITVICDDCGATVSVEAIEAPGHNIVDGECKNCDFKEDVVHDCEGGKATCTEYAKCTICGEAYGDLADHDYKDDDKDCTTNNKCSVCGDEEVDSAKDHTFVDGACSECGAEDPNAGPKVPTYVKVTNSSDITTGTYVLVVNGYVMTKYDSSGWVLVEKFTGTGDTIESETIATWTLTVSGSSVTLKDSAGTFIKPKSGNNNGIQTGSYNWNWTFSNSTVRFDGTGSDTTRLAANTQSDNKIRSYKTTTATGSSNQYPCDFTLYKLVE